MTAVELEGLRLQAAYTLAEIREHGGYVLRIVDGDKWKLRLYNGAAVPMALKVQLFKLQTVTMILLRELVSREKDISV